LRDFKEESPPTVIGGPEDCNAENAAPSYANTAKLAIPKRRSRRKAKRKRAATKSCAREVAAYSGQIYLGTVRLTTGAAIAFSPDDRKIGVFGSEQAAIDPLDKLALRP
jgi:hypothetical protein